MCRDLSTRTKTSLVAIWIIAFQLWGHLFKISIIDCWPRSQILGVGQGGTDHWSGIHTPLDQTAQQYGYTGKSNVPQIQYIVMSYDNGDKIINRQPLQCKYHQVTPRAPVKPERTGTPFRFLFGRTVVQNLGLLALLMSYGALESRDWRCWCRQQ